MFVKHEYLQSCAYICLSHSSPEDIFYQIIDFWDTCAYILNAASKNFVFRCPFIPRLKWAIFHLQTLMVELTFEKLSDCKYKCNIYYRYTNVVWIALLTRQIMKASWLCLCISELKWKLWPLLHLKLKIALCKYHQKLLPCYSEFNFINLTKIRNVLLPIISSGQSQHFPWVTVSIGCLW